MKIVKVLLTIHENSKMLLTIHENSKNVINNP